MIIIHLNYLIKIFFYIDTVSISYIYFILGLCILKEGHGALGASFSFGNFF